MKIETNFRPQASFELIILSYNHPEHTAKCIQSVLNIYKEKNINKKPRVVHNGSDTKHIHRLKSQFNSSTVEHLDIDINRGFSGGANYGLKKIFTDTNVEWVLFLTNDTELISIGNPPLEPGLFSITLHKRKLDGSIDSIMGSLNLKSGQLRHIQNQSEVNTLSRIPHTISYIPGTAFWIHRDTFSTTQGFDESFHTYWEDVDLSYRIHTHSDFRIGYNSSTVAIHKIGKTCHKNDFYTYFLFQRNRKRFMLKHKKTNHFFWMIFIFNILKNCKGRWHYLWRIIHE